MTLILSSAKPSLWIIELHNGEDNRLTLELVDNGLKPALDTVEREWRKQWRAAQNAKNSEAGKGALIIVGRKDQDKFFSNGVYIPAPFLMALLFIRKGLDFPSVVANPNFFPSTCSFEARYPFLIV